MNMERRTEAICSLLLSAIVLFMTTPTANAAQNGLSEADSKAVSARQALEQRVNVQRAAIEKENAISPSAPWAGTYYEGDGTGANVDISLSPKSGVVATWQGCLGMYEANMGQVTATSGGMLALKYKYPNDPKGIGFADHVVPVAWGDRMYLLSTGELAAFASAINLGEEPRQEAQGIFLMRKGDEKRKVSNLPSLPPEVLQLIHRTPQRLNVLAVSRLSEKAAYGMCKITYRLKLDHGALDGLAKEMQLRQLGDEVWNKVTLIEVQPTVSFAEDVVYNDSCTSQKDAPTLSLQYTTGAYYAKGGNTSVKP